ncbi:MAG TPA: pyridoxal 5'-phosphate synthase glutaminase subunit PdxT [Chloroflexota bacterium]|nr:pyridoxal 5'-phosphate synthase glutaminase subunit PdxT [Chloroflexota bacterium]
MVVPRIGVLALQGDIAEHQAMLDRSGARPAAVKRAEQLDEIDGLVIPGGESTAIGKLLRRFEMLEPLRARIDEGLPVYGTCAGMILMADNVEEAGTDQPVLGGMHISVRRNAFGRQRESFETDLTVPAVGAAPLHAVFIRAPVIERVGEDVDVLASLPDGRAVAARQGSLLVSSFHPELTEDTRMHRYFVDIVRGAA